MTLGLRSGLPKFPWFNKRKPTKEVPTYSRGMSVTEKSSVRDRVKGALWGAFIGDALAAPTHWYYGGYDQVVRDYNGPITDYTKPVMHLQGSIMNKSNTGGGGRGSASGDVIGQIINHGKKHLWQPGQGFHYHCTLDKGENTLEARLLRLLLESITASGGKFNEDHFRQSYINFMTTPGSHNDAYASTCHRMFFANLKINNLPPNQCPDNDRHNVDTIDGLILPVGVALASLEAQPQEAVSQINDCIQVTRRSAALPKFTPLLSSIMREVVLNGIDLSQAVKSFSSQAGINLPTPPIQDPMTACYIDSSFPSLLLMSIKYSGNVTKGLLANANCGGENVHRGSVLGALLGASVGMQGLEARWIQGLKDSKEIGEVIDKFVDSVLPDNE